MTGDIFLEELPGYECLREASACCRELSPCATGAYLQLRRTGIRIENGLRGQLAAHRLSQGRFAVLMLLRHTSDRRVSPADLAGMLGVARATVTGLVDGLEHDGLVVRLPDPDDRRKLLLEITEKGLELLERVVPGYLRWVAATMKPLTVAECRTLVRLLEKLHAGKQKAGEPAAEGLQQMQNPEC